MGKKATCSYCGNDDYTASERNMTGWMDNRGLVIKFPICWKCARSFRKGEIPATVTRTELSVLAEVKKCNEMAGHLSKKTPLHEIAKLIEVVEGFSVIHADAVAEFEKASAIAHEAAKKMEWIRQFIDSTKSKIEEKLHISYQFCRKAANAKIASPELRKAIFERDGYACKKCGNTENLSVDHIKPVKFGGGDEFENYQTLCLSCNCRKGAKI